MARRGKPRRPTGQPSPPRLRAALLAVTVLAAVAALAGLAWRYCHLTFGTPSAGNGPIILISIDTLRADRLPAYGYQGVQTPAIDALAGGGVLFERAYAHSPQTLPSHVSMLTGRLPFEHGVRDNIGFTIPSDAVMLQHRLRERGYVTGGVVSSYVVREEVGIGRGFDFFDSHLPVASPEMSIAQVQRDGTETLEVARRWLETQTDRRLFLFFHIYEPHTPYHPPARYAKYDPYDGEIAYADEIVGRLFDLLKARNLYDGATIVLLSDHGEGLGDHGELEHGVFLYDETVRVPFIIKLPRGGARGVRVAQPVQLVDLVPTLLDLVGAPVPADLPGRSLGPLLDDPSARIPEQGIYAEALYPRYHFGWSELLSLTDERYRFIKAPRPELYDLTTDPDERTNLAVDRPRTAAAIRMALDRLVEGRAIDRPSPVSEEAREQFQALGYVSTQADVAPDVPGETLPDPKDKVPVLEKYRRAVDLAGARQFQEAIGLLQEILSGDPGMVDVWQQLGNLQVRAGRYDGALESYRRLVELKPSDPTGLVAVAATLLKLRRLDEAWKHGTLAAELAESTSASPRTQAGAHEILVKIALARKDGDAARRHAALAQQADPSLPLPIYVQALMRYNDGRYADALPLFQETLRQLGSRTLSLTDLHYYLGDTLARLERYGEAERHFLEEIRLAPNHARARAGLAMLYRATGRDAEVERMIENLLRAVPTTEGYDLAAQLWTIFGDRDRAAAVRAEAARRFSTQMR